VSLLCATFSLKSGGSAICAVLVECLIFKGLALSFDSCDFSIGPVPVSLPKRMFQGAEAAL
jgi:hypothetical protein